MGLGSNSRLGILDVGGGVDVVTELLDFLVAVLGCDCCESQKGLGSVYRSSEEYPW